MRALTYCRLSLVLPLLVPIVAWGLGQAGFFRAASTFLVGTLLIGGVPYLLVAAILITVSFRVSAERFVYWWHFSPFLMALLFGVWAVAMNLYYGEAPGWIESRASRLFMAWVVGAIYCLVVGYVYVLVAKLLYFALGKAKMIQADVPGHAPFA